MMRMMTNFFNVTCHIDSNLRAKIAKGEFVELDKLLPKTINQIMQGSQEQEGIEVIRNGSSYVLPPINKESQINNVRRWKQAFRVYAAIYSEHTMTELQKSGNMSILSIQQLRLSYGKMWPSMTTHLDN